MNEKEGKVLVPPLAELEKKKKEAMKDFEIKTEFNKFKEEIKGKVVLLYGVPLVGKSVFCLTLSKLFEKSILFLIDKNYPAEFFSINPKIQIIEIDEPKQLDMYISKLPSIDDQLIIIDSITTLQTSFIRKDYWSARIVNEFNMFADKIARQLHYLKPRTTSVMIAHEKLTDWEKKTVGPRVSWIVMRNMDLAYRMYQEDGVRKIKLTHKRTVPKELKWVFE
jgi:predicted ATP-dependent serine protease